MKVLISIVLLIVLIIIAFNMRIEEQFLGEEILGERLIQLQMSQKGPQGPKGEDGGPGKSAYNIALEKAREGDPIPVWAQDGGDEGDWLASLQGSPGPTGSVESTITKSKTSGEWFFI